MDIWIYSIKAKPMYTALSILNNVQCLSKGVTWGCIFRTAFRQPVLYSKLDLSGTESIACCFSLRRVFLWDALLCSFTGSVQRSREGRASSGPFPRCCRFRRRRLSSQHRCQRLISLSFFLCTHVYFLFPPLGPLHKRTFTWQYICQPWQWFSAEGTALPDNLGHLTIVLLSEHSTIMSIHL